MFSVKEMIQYLIDYINAVEDQAMYHHLCEFHDNENACEREKEAKERKDGLFNIINGEMEI